MKTPARISHHCPRSEGRSLRIAAQQLLLWFQKLQKRGARTGEICGLVLLAVLLLAGPLFADIIHLKNGRTLEGVILSDDGREIRLKTNFGAVTVKHADIARIEKKLTPIDEVRTRKAKLRADDAEGHYQLALFCRENGLKKDEKQLYRETLSIDGQHPGANEAVGNVEYLGEWMSPAERDRRKAASSEAEMRAKGLVRHDGKWVTPEDKARLEKGLVKHDGRWMTPDQVKEEQGYVKYKGGWIRKEELERRKLKDLYGKMLGIEVEVAFSEHYVAVGPFTPAELASICAGAEQVYAEFLQIFGLSSNTNLFVGSEEDSDRGRCHLVYAKKAFDYAKFVQAFSEKYPQNMPPARANLVKTTKGFYEVYPSCTIVGYMFPNSFDQVRASVIHKASHVLLMRYKYVSGFFPWWLIEGLGTYQEINAIRRCDTYCITEKGYAVTPDANGGANQKWSGMGEWKQIVKMQVVGMGDKGLIRLGRSGLNELDYRDLAKCWSLCEWLIRTDRKKFVALVEKLKAKADIKKAVQQAYGMSAEQLDKEWREYVRANY